MVPVGEALYLALLLTSFAAWLHIGWTVVSGNDVLTSAAVPLRHPTPRVLGGTLFIWASTRILIPFVVDLTRLQLTRTGALPFLCACDAVTLFLILKVYSSSDGQFLQKVKTQLRDAGDSLVEGVRWFLAAFGPVQLVALSTESLRTEETQHKLVQMLLAPDVSLSTVALVVLMAVILAPLIEELVFRAILQRGLAAFLPDELALVFTATLFCAIHGFPDALAIAPLALILGFMYQQRQCYVTVVVTHALFNATTVVLALVSGGTG